jgi:hypothetical protein
MSKFRRALICGACAVGLLMLDIRPAKAVLGVGDIVFDPTAFAQLIKSYAQELKAYLLQYQQYVTQTQQYLTQIQQYYTEVQLFINWVHNPSLGGALGLMQMAGLGTYLPIQPMQMLGLINGLSSAASGNLSLGGISALFGQLNAFAGQSFTTNHIYSPMDGGWQSQQMNATAASIAGMQGGAMNSYDGLQLHMAAQEALRDHSIGLTSPKDVADTQLQVLLEQIWTENNNGQVLASIAAYDAQRDSREQREMEGTTQSMDNFIAACGGGL